MQYTTRRLNGFSVHLPGASRTVVFRTVSPCGGSRMLARVQTTTVTAQKVGLDLGIPH
jgi:hypothetical protein